MKKKESLKASASAQLERPRVTALTLIASLFRKSKSSGLPRVMDSRLGSDIRICAAQPSARSLEDSKTSGQSKTKSKRISS